MKKKVLLVMCALLVTLTSCGKDAQDNMGCRCSSNGCSCCKCTQKVTEDIEIEDANKVLGLLPETSVVPESTGIEMGTETAESIATEVTATVQTQTMPETESIVETIEEPVQIKDLTEGQKEARRQLLQQLAQQRELLYALPNSEDKMKQIAQIDAMMIENSVYDFSEDCITFVGDSITEGVCGKLTEEGNRISYVDYVQDYLNVGQVLNRGMAGRMFSGYGNVNYSLAQNLENVLYVASDATVVFLGVNDYLAEQTDKRYGEQDVNSVSTAGYCGALRETMNCFKLYFQNQDIFFVLVYDVDRQVNATYTDVTPAPSLKEFMDMQKKYVEHYGFNVIDLYSTGIMDLSVPEIKSMYTEDGLHPNDNGNVILAQHIAAELALYYSNK